MYRKGLLPTEPVNQHPQKLQNSSASVSVLPPAPSLPYNRVVTTVIKELGLQLGSLNA